MPTLDRLAGQGLRYNNLHTSALCSPTRAALLTGRNHHTNNTGAVQDVATAFPGQTGKRPASACRRRSRTWCGAGSRRSTAAGARRARCADGCVLLLEERATTVDPAALHALGLTAREAEVLVWVAAGKTNAETAAILGARPRTIEKHLERIYPKLGVENRTAAASVVRRAPPR